MYKYSMTQWIAGDEDLEESFRRLKSCGYDGIEFAAEPDTPDRDRLKSLMEKYGISCTSLCGIFPESRDLSSGDPEKAGRAVQYVKDSVDLAVETGASCVIVVPSPVGRTAPLPGVRYEEAWGCAVENVRRAAKYAEGKKVTLAVEAINRYETYLVNNMEKNLRFVKEVNHPSVRLMADCFHMSIEERSIPRTLHRVADYLVHVHIADNTREAAGLGSTDFKEILRTLREIGYKGALTMEFLPDTADPYAAFAMETRTERMDGYAKQSIDYMRMMEKSIS